VVDCKHPFTPAGIKKPRSIEPGLWAQVRTGTTRRSVPTLRSGRRKRSLYTEIRKVVLGTTSDLYTRVYARTPSVS
jgi:hypothetical protein